jgi:UDP-N-acetylmuramoyl-tripeptide--D-alanyl-D-alanine ligase
MLGVFYDMKTELLDLFLASTGVCTDTRSIAAGNLFISLKGANFDGNTYARKAIAAGAKFALIDDPKFYLGEQTILVEDCLTSLQQLANSYRKTFDIPILAITGTNGKTTTKELITEVLKKKFRTQSTLGNLNNHIGVPLTLLSMPRDTEIGIIEMGANHIGEIKELCEIAEPNFGIITNIGKAHLEGFGNLNGVIKAKTDLNRFLIKEGGSLFINADDALLMQQAKPEDLIKYGTLQGLEFTYTIQQGAGPFAGIQHKECALKSNLTGSYNNANIAAASCIGKYFKVPILEIKHAIEDYAPSNKRSQFLETANNAIILDAYNANPSSMEAAISDFARIEHNNKLLILGDMFELGKDSKKEHQTVVDLLISQHLPAILIGKEFLKTTKQDSFQYFENCKDFIVALEESEISDKFILLKGSRGMSLEQLVSYL